MSNKLNIQIKSDSFSTLLEKLEDLAKISDTIKLKVDSDNILMYSIVGETILLAFKSYLLDTKDFFENLIHKQFQKHLKFHELIFV